MGLSLGAISRRLTQLEARLGVTLLHRTTRTVVLTDRGRQFFQRATHLLTELETAEQEAARDAETLTGPLRVTAAMEFGRRRLAPLLQEFRLMHPQLRVHLDAVHQDANLVEGGYDLAIWVGDLPDSSLIVRRLAPNQRVICASPDYLRRRGTPRDLSELSRHDCIVVGPPDADRWRLAGGQSVRLNQPLTTNDPALAHAWAVGGAGLAVKSVWDVEGELQRGELEVVLPQVALPNSSVNAVYPRSRDAAAKVRACIGFLAERLKSVPPRLGETSAPNA